MGLFFSGCVMKAPKNSQEYRKSVVESSFGDQISVVVDQPYKKVIKTLERNTKKCLDKSYEVTYYESNNVGTFRKVKTVELNPTLINHKKSLELQMHMYDSEICESMLSKDTCLGKKGYWVFVLDAEPHKKQKTMLNIYQPSKGLRDDVDKMTNAIQLWAKGKTNACPDLTN